MNDVEHRCLFQGRFVDGVQKYTARFYYSIDEFEEEWGDDYVDQAGFQTSEEADQAMDAWAQKNLNRTYSAAQLNCGDFASGVLKAGGIDLDMSRVTPTIPNQMLRKSRDMEQFNPGPTNYIPARYRARRSW